MTCGEVAIAPSAGGTPLLFEYIFKGVRFQVYGTFGPGFGLPHHFRWALYRNNKSVCEREAYILVAVHIRHFNLRLAHD